MLTSIVASIVFGDTLRDKAQKLRLNLGTCARPEYIRDNVDGGKYVTTLEREFNMVEPENDLKPPALWRGVGQYNFENSDYLVDWARKHHTKVRGHVLVYASDQGYTIPRWLLDKENTISKEEAETMLRDYIHTVVGRYAGKISMWDVVNEAISDSPNKNPFNLRDSFWFRKLGPDFLVLAFKFAHEADRRAELYYNEYGVEGGGKKTEHMLELVKFLKEKGAPITGVGLQYHSGLWEKFAPGDGHYQLLAEIEKLGLAFQITELDFGIPVAVYPRNDSRRGLEVKNPPDLTIQAERFADVFRMAMSFKNCHGIQMWGFTDRHNWIPDLSRGERGAACIFNAEYEPKPAYTAVSDILGRRK